MFRNYLKTSLRNLLKYRVFSFINVFGLAVAMAVCMLLILMVADQLRYDSFEKDGDRIYRVLSGTEGGRNPYATSPFPLAQALASYPVVEEATHLTPGIGGDASTDLKLAEMRGYFADSSFFRVFDFTLDQGNASVALNAPRSVIISKTLSRHLFGEENPIGKTIGFADRQLSFPIASSEPGSAPVDWGSFTVTGVIDESRYKSHLTFDALVSASTMLPLYADKKLEDQSNDWTSYWRTYTYVKLQRGKTESDLQQALNNLVQRTYVNIQSEQTKGFYLKPQSLHDIQFDTTGNDTSIHLPPVGYTLLSVLVLIVLFSALLNYVNLSVARAFTRLREIGVRKVTGADRRALTLQFLVESMATSFVALLLALGVLALLRSAFLHLWVNQFLNFELPTSIGVYLSFIGFALLVGLVAGLYPAFKLSGFKTLRAMQRTDGIVSGKPRVRKVLSVAQFVVSLLFITSSILVLEQFRHYRHFDYGFNPHNIVNIPLQGHDYHVLSTEFGRIPGVVSVSASDIIPSAGISNGMPVKVEGDAHEDDYTSCRVLNADEAFIGNLGIALVAGRNLSDDPGAILINESAVRTFGFGSAQAALGQTLLSKWGDHLRIAGVVSDFRYDLLINRDKISPVMIRSQPESFQYLNVRLGSAHLQATLSSLRKSWTTIDPIHPFKYDFYDDQLAATSRGLFDLVSILSLLAFLAITISCLGLLGITIYVVERRTKEVAVRKVFGAMDRAITILLSREFAGILLLSVAIGGPLSYLANEFWLEKLPNRVDFGAGIVLLSVAILLALGLLTIGSQTIRTARQNPVKALRME